MNTLTTLLVLFGSLGIFIFILFLADYFRNRKIEQNRKWKEMENVWVDLNSGEVKFYLNDNGAYKLKL